MLRAPRAHGNAGRSDEASGVSNAQRPTPNTNTEHEHRTRTPNTAHRTPNTEHRTPNAERRTPNAEHRTPNAERRTPNAERRTPNTEHRTPNAEHRTPNAKRLTSRTRPSRRDKMIVGWRFSACKAKGRRSVPAGRLKRVLVPEIFVPRIADCVSAKLLGTPL
jgi:hypothetical protein